MSAESRAHQLRALAARAEDDAAVAAILDGMLDDGDYTNPSADEAAAELARDPDLAYLGPIQTKIYVRDVALAVAREIQPAVGRYFAACVRAGRADVSLITRVLAVSPALVGSTFARERGSRRELLAAVRERPIAIDDPTICTTVVAFLADHDPAVVAGAARALARVNDPKIAAAIDAHATAMRTRWLAWAGRNAAESEAAIWAAAVSRVPDLQPILANALRANDPRARGVVEILRAEMFGTLRADPSLVGTLVSALAETLVANDGRPRRPNVGKLAAMLPDARAVAALTDEMLRDESRLQYRDGSQRAAAEAVVAIVARTPAPRPQLLESAMAMFESARPYHPRHHGALVLAALAAVEPERVRARIAALPGERRREAIASLQWTSGRALPPEAKILLPLLA